MLNSVENVTDRIQRDPRVDFKLHFSIQETHNASKAEKRVFSARAGKLLILCAVEIKVPLTTMKAISKLY